MTSSRWFLILKTRLVRGLGSLLQPLIAILTGKRTYAATFSRRIPTTIARKKGTISLEFYTPRNYYETRAKATFPTVINFHGGGFCIGTATDDAQWAQALVEECNAVVVSVAYRLAPEHRFPTAVEDGVDALLYLLNHADELGLDVDRMATSGFSAGGNMAITVPLMYQHVMRERGQQPAELKAMVAWYSSTDYTRSRAQRIATMVRPEKQLPKFLTQIFDEGYLPPVLADRSSPFLSPFVAPVALLRGLPPNFILFTCEWDMVEKEAMEFAIRLEKECGKNVKAKMIPGVPHGWDKYPRASPDPWDFYVEACVLLNRAFEGGSVAGG